MGGEFDREELTIIRKFEHIEHCLKRNVQAHVTNGFEDVHFVHMSLPEIDKDEIDLSVEFLGRKFDYPIFIAGMTGGTKVHSSRGGLTKPLPKPPRSSTFRWALAVREL